MPTININSGGGAGGGGGRRRAGGQSLDEIFLDLLRNPSPAKEREFANLWRTALPTSTMLAGGFTGLGARDVMSQIAQAVKTLRSAGPGLHGGLYANRASMATGILRRYGGGSPEISAALSVMRNMAGGGRSGGGGAVPAIIRREERALVNIEKATSGTFQMMRYSLRASSWRMRGGGFGGGGGIGFAGGGGMGLLPPPGGGGGLGPSGGWSAFPASSAPGRSGRARGGGFGGLGGGLMTAAELYAGYKALQFGINPFTPIGSLEQGALGTAGPYMDLRRGAFALGRAGGFGGQGLQDALYPSGVRGGSGSAIPSWMGALGMGSGGAMQSLMAYGIPARSAAGNLSLAQHLGYLENVSPGFAGMAPGTATAAARQGGGIGIGGPGSNYMSMLQGSLESASARGMDRSRVLESIESILASMEKGGALGIDSRGTMSLISQLSGAGTPGARTGALAASTISGVTSAIGSFGSSAPTTMAMMTMLNKNPPTSVAAVAKTLGMSGDELNSMMASNPALKFWVEGTMSEWQRGSRGTAGMAFANVAGMAPGGMAGAFGGFMNDIKGITPTMRALGMNTFGVGAGAAPSILGGTGGSVPSASGSLSSYMKAYDQSGAAAHMKSGPQSVAGVPTDVGAAQTSADNMALMGAQQSFVNFGSNIAIINDVLEKLPKSIERFGKGLDWLASKMNFPGGDMAPGAPAPVAP